jgi:hypothetical protein
LFARTLQELLAPHSLDFYDKDWKWCGNRERNHKDLAKATGILPEVLKFGFRYEHSGWAHTGTQYLPAPKKYSIAERMSWASKRETTRPEDLAYCLLGIFDVSMPPLYGEGSRKAFRRLQEEIMKTSTDLSILVWTSSTLNDESSCLAQTPRWFSDVESTHFDMQFEDVITEHFSMTNKGLLITLPIVEDSRSKKGWTAKSHCIVMLPGVHLTSSPIVRRCVALRVIEVRSSQAGSQPGVERVRVFYREKGEKPIAVSLTALKTAKWTKMYLQ